jgi:hypothetical protein
MSISCPCRRRGDRARIGADDMTEELTHRVMATAAGMTAEVFQGRLEECVAVATSLIGKPFRDKDGEQIGTVDHTWTEPA